MDKFVDASKSSERGYFYDKFRVLKEKFSGTRSTMDLGLEGWDGVKSDDE